ncbi:MAG: hypothetical protein K2O14_01405 [Oscillospiraceae bacterium]|nr:hypothetical protein [Oscillospiraceae bacterium]
MAQHLTELPEISMEGFQVVSGELFVHPPAKKEASCTIWYTSISFSKASLYALNCCERIRIEVNSKTKCILLVPVTAKDKDGIRWVKGIKETTTRKIECKAFTSQLYKTWGLNPNMVYRTYGRIVAANNKIMLLFDFSDSKSWRSKIEVKA